MTNEYSQLDVEMAQLMRVLFQANLRNLLAEPSRLESLATLAGIPQARVPEIRAALTKGFSAGLSS